MKSRLRSHCEDGHQPWPAKGRHTRHTAEPSRRTRENHYATDVGAVRSTGAKGRRRPRLELVDLDTGEINDLYKTPVAPIPARRSTAVDH
jgi:hypothetical protein